MKQVFTDTQTRLIQGLLAVLFLVNFISGVYAYGITPNVGGFEGIIEFVLVFIIGNILSLWAAAGVLMLANLVFFQIQTYRHGSYHEQVEDWSE